MKWLFSNLYINKGILFCVDSLFFGKNKYRILIKGFNLFRSNKLMLEQLQYYVYQKKCLLILGLYTREHNLFHMSYHIILNLR